MKGHLWMAVLAAVWCAGCPALLITKGATEAASVAVDDRSLEQQAVDLALKARIEKALLEANLAAPVHVDVYLEHVMLTGVVPDGDARREAADIARRTAAGHEIWDDLEVATGRAIADAAANLAANKALGLTLLADEGVASPSLHHRVVNGTAFIMGQVETESQIESARRAALRTPGVHDVVTHILVRP